MEALVLLAVGVTNILCFMVGAKVGQAVSRGEEVNLPNPVEAIEKHKTKRREEQEMDKMNTILQNIESYDGTSVGQRDVPKR